MNVPELYPFLLEPAYKDYIWGGSRIPARFNRDQPEGVYAESWELSDRPEGMSFVANGPLKGQSLAELVTRFGKELLGHGIKSDSFPLLVKLIDAKERLSIQVHPDDASAALGIGEAKTEAWHILDAPKGGQVFAGLKPNITEVSFLAALKTGQLEGTLQSVPATAGDTIFIPGGRVHAICEGLLILEIQQNSNTTYRVYDWGRVDKAGKPRELHLDQALKVIHWTDAAPVKTIPRPISEKSGALVTELVVSPYFRLEKLDITAPFFVQHDGASFQALFSEKDDIKIMCESGTETVPGGCTCLIPAKLNRYTLKPTGKQATVLRISVPVTSPT
ncbi:MAG: type I phosphomannose isomerase catalytic subunit [bacterium]